MKKATVINLLNSFGDEIDSEQLIERLLFIDDVERGLQDSEEGKLISL